MKKTNIINYNIIYYNIMKKTNINAVQECGPQPHLLPSWRSCHSLFES